jgi:hypothetical protein
MGNYLNIAGAINQSGMVIYRINISGAGLIDVVEQWRRPLNVVDFD